MVRRPSTLQLFASVAIPLMASACSLFSPAETLAVVYVGRNITPDFDQLHERIISHLVDKYNRENPEGVRLRFERRDAKINKATIDQPGLQDIYRHLATRSDVVAVIDNCWGVEIAAAKDDIRALQVPIIFLNADMKDTNFGVDQGARLFLGDSEVAKDQIVLLVQKLLEDSATDQVPILVDETEYGLTDRFLQPLNGLSPTRITLSGARPTPEALQRAQRELTAAIGRQGGTTSTVLVLNVHDDWGASLLPWIDTTFRHIIVVGYESINSRGRTFSGAPSTNQVIILGHSPQSVPEVLAEIYRDQKNRYPQLYQRDNALLYVRRSFVAMDLITRQLLGLNRPSINQATRLPAGDRQASRQSASAVSVRGHVNAALKTLSAAADPSSNSDEMRSTKSSLGILTFDRNGVELGSNHIIVYRNNYSPSSYLVQPNSRNDLIPNIQFGFRDIKITDVNIGSRTFHADFYLWIRYGQAAANLNLDSCEPSPPRGCDEAARITNLFAFGDHLEENFQLVPVSTERIQDITQMFFHASGRFTGHFVGWKYPFDKQQIALELRVKSPDSAVKITPDQYETVPSETSADIDGWHTLDSSMTVNSRAADEILIPRDTFSNPKQQQQYSHARLSFTVRRGFWSPALLVFCPLALITLASLAVLFIKSDDGVSGKTDTVSQQNELTMGCVLAVVTYLMAYVTLAPRLAQPTLADALVGFTLLVSVFNFVFCAVISRRTTRWYWRLLTLHRYRWGASALSALAFGSWMLVTIIFTV